MNGLGWKGFYVYIAVKDNGFVKNGDTESRGICPKL